MANKLAPPTYSLHDGKRASPILSSGGIRSDGRSLESTRPAFFKTGAVSAAAGSAYAEFGQTKVIVSVFGPRESKKAQAFSDTGRLNCHVKFTTFATAVRGKPNQSLDSAEYSSALYKSLAGAIDLHSFPKTTVDVFALILQSGGGDLSVVINCASLALADAGIAMYDLVSAISASFIRDMILLDPTDDEQRSEDGSLLVAHMTSRNEITHLTMTGEWSSGRISEGLELCVEACVSLGKAMRSCLKDAAMGMQ